MSAEVSFLPVTPGQASSANGITPDAGPGSTDDPFSSLLAQALGQNSSDGTDQDLGQLLQFLSSQSDGQLAPQISTQSAGQAGTENIFLFSGNMLPLGKLSKSEEAGDASDQTSQGEVAGLPMLFTLQLPPGSQLAVDTNADQATATLPATAMQWQGMVAYGDSEHPAVTQYFISNKDPHDSDLKPLAFLPVQDGDHAASPQSLDAKAPHLTSLMMEPANFVDAQGKPILFNAMPHLGTQANQFMLALQGQVDMPEANVAQHAGSTSDPQNPIGVSLVYTQQSNSSSHAQLPPMGITPEQPTWGEALGNRVNWLVNHNFQQADIRLDPPDLGSLDVRIRVTGQDQIANITFSSPHAQVRDAVEHALPRLREMFADAGLSLGDVNVSQQSMGDNRHPSQQMAGEFNQGNARGRTSQGGGGAEPKEIEGIATTVRRGVGLVDTYA